MTAASMRVGCLGACLDGSAMSLSLRGVSAAGFVGTWYGTVDHLAIPVDRRGRPLPPPEGYFCARRTDG